MGFVKGIVDEPLSSSNMVMVLIGQNFVVLVLSGQVFSYIRFNFVAFFDYKQQHTKCVYTARTNSICHMDWWFDSVAETILCVLGLISYILT